MKKMVALMLAALLALGVLCFGALEAVVLAAFAGTALAGIGGVNPERDLVEIVELPNHPWFVGVQYHPELRSRPNRPHPLFREFVGAALKAQDFAAIVEAAK